jgi:hypothetical protein
MIKKETKKSRKNDASPHWLSRTPPFFRPHAHGVRQLELNTDFIFNTGGHFIDFLSKTVNTIRALVACFFFFLCM